MRNPEQQNYFLRYYLSVRTAVKTWITWWFWMLSTFLTGLLRSVYHIWIGMFPFSVLTKSNSKLKTPSFVSTSIQNILGYGFCLESVSLYVIPTDLMEVVSSSDLLTWSQNFSVRCMSGLMKCCWRWRSYLERPRGWKNHWSVQRCSIRLLERVQVAHISKPSLVFPTILDSNS